MQKRKESQNRLIEGTHGNKRKYTETHEETQTPIKYAKILNNKVQVYVIKSTRTIGQDHVISRCPDERPS